MGKKGDLSNFERGMAVGARRVPVSSPLQVGKRGYNFQELTKIVHPSCLVTTVQAGDGGVMLWGMFSWHTSGPLVPIGHL